MFVTIAGFFQSGGTLMWMIVAVLGVAVAVIAERVYFYTVICRQSADVLAADTAAKLNEGDLQGALETVSAGTSPAHLILTRAVERYRDGVGFAEIRRGVEEVAIREVPRYARRLGYLSMLANIATLSGLLGTIFGLQRSFSSLTVASAAEKASVLASGISQAMNTTAFGLIVAIPCMIAYSRLASMQARRTEDCDAAGVKLLNYLENRIENQSVRLPRAVS